jgi:hypothetical protein
MFICIDTSMNVSYQLYMIHWIGGCGLNTFGSGKGQVVGCFEQVMDFNFHKREGIFLFTCMTVSLSERILFMELLVY